ncbi:aromatic-L-amino-acid decarboxylase isoform X2 [Octopus bimaculoides]|uniref:aromatic-L-amino-acid decarboxylase isoform X2 n=1 Tax=Octopus bimaculoides TaxID=37653 RepID=UPI0022E3E0BD|nr:aromatic-L-amino-acid decarboxylase isoform X2 [Octopus bimaculoides]
MEKSENFDAATKQLTKYIIDYFGNIGSRNAYPAVEPGFMKTLIPAEAPETPDKWENVFNDIERVIMPGVCHWHHPKFGAYFPARTSYAAILAAMLSDALVNVVISWKSAPAATELEVIVLDWLAKAIKLPEIFLSTSEGSGGGVIQTHSSFAKACKIALVKVRDIKLDDKRSMRGSSLKKAIEEDGAKGLVPFYICSTLGTTSVCAFDNIKEIGAVCKDEGIWLHIDAAYAGNAFICPEYRYLMNGVEYADSICMSPHKWLQVPIGCSVLWLQNSNKLVDSIPEPGEYLQCTENSEMPNFMTWQIPCGRPFRSLKLWFVLRIFGIHRLQELIRKDIQLAHMFKDLIEKDGRFELIGENIMSLVCFRLKGSNELNELLYKMINETREIHISNSEVNEILFLRFVVNTYHSDIQDMQYCFNVIGKLAEEVLSSCEKTSQSLN